MSHKKQRVHLPVRFNRMARIKASGLIDRPDFVSIGDTKDSNVKVFNFIKHQCTVDILGRVKWQTKSGRDCTTPKVFWG